ncbi:hypothetical protein HGG82_07870 [Marinomonas sp. M1K-6]|uniref:Uncharacterized protein n=1 Tax=Marinomonas profundi TaxID=2726122 RepID=A0A847R9C0_9GAMM|nr:hypothetical protein [Marinomonas profundi]NLQ17544.1 hypothetical protein [Marinomonas profundi]UDV02239.1 hypothetical protein J8N69_11610 [Marinomonas profundi]
MLGIDWLVLGAAALVSWGVNTLLAPEPPPPRPICYVIEPHGDGQLSTPVWCDEVVKK